MARKQVNFLAKAKADANKPDIDDWVQTRGEKNETSKKTKKEAKPPEKMKRLTLDIPDSLHRVIKGKAVTEGKTMAVMLRDLLETTYRKK